MPSMTTAFSLAPKRLHEMNRLEDIGRFPTMIYVGATAKCSQACCSSTGCTVMRAAICL